MRDTVAQSKRLISIPEATESYGGTVHMWRNLVWTSQIPIVKIGRKFFLDTQDIERFIAQNKARYEI